MKIEEENEKNAQELPIYKKGKEIYKVIDQICQVIENDQLSLGKEKDAILNTAKLLSERVLAVDCDQNFETKMRDASIIRRAVFELPFAVNSIEAYGFKNSDYFNIVRPLIEEYRIIFIDWVSGFDEWDKSIDLWDLLKLPEIGPSGQETD